MRRILLDTNVLLSFLTDRDEGQQLQAADLFRAAARGDLELVLHQVAVTEMVYVLLNLYDMPAAEVASVLTDLLAMPGVTAVHEIVWPLLLETWPAQIPTFADAALAAVASHLRCDGVATFDVPFSKRLARRGLTPIW